MIPSNLFFETLDQVIRLNPDFLRIHPTLVLKEAPIEALWADGKYSPLTLEESDPMAQEGIVEIGEGADSSGPDRPSADKGPGALHSCRSLSPRPAPTRGFGDLFRYGCAPSRYHQNEKESCFYCHPGEVSSVRGQKNRNIHRLKEHFGVKSESHVRGKGGYSERFASPSDSIRRKFDSKKRFIKMDTRAGRLKVAQLTYVHFVLRYFPLFFDLFFLLASCLPKRQVVYERRSAPPERRETRKEGFAERKPALPEREEIEKRGDSGGSVWDCFMVWAGFSRKTDVKRRYL